MSNLPSLKALVIDDQPAEALQVLQALQLLGIGGLFYDGGANNPFGQVLPAPQLLFLDMVLGEHGADINDEPGCRRLLFQAIENITKLGSSPLVVVCWSGHQNLFQDFSTEFTSRFPNGAKTVFLRADKAEFFQPADPTALTRLRDHIRSGLKDLGLLGLLFEWELLVARAAAVTVQKVVRLGGQDEEPNTQGVVDTQEVDEICGFLALAEGGTRLAAGKTDSTDCISGLFLVLQSLLLDRLEHQTASQNLNPAYGARLKTCLQAAKTTKDNQFRELRKEQALHEASEAIWRNLGCDIAAGCAEAYDGSAKEPRKPMRELAIELNTMLLMARNSPPNVATPGTMYLLGGTSGKDQPLQVGGMERKKVIQDTLRGAEVGTEMVVLVECTPSCDFSQNKRRLPRIVAGVLVSLDQARELPGQAEYLRQVGPIQLDHQAPSMNLVLVLNGHFVSGLSEPELVKLTAVGRLRSSVLADITGWLGHHIARPGYVSF